MILWRWFRVGVSSTSHLEELVLLRVVDYWISWNKMEWFCLFVYACDLTCQIDWFYLRMWESECGIFIWSCSQTVLAIKMCWKSWCQRSPWVLIDVIGTVGFLFPSPSFMAKLESPCVFYSAWVYEECWYSTDWVSFRRFPIK